MDNNLNLIRIPATDHPSLKAWNAADELMANDSPTKEQTIGIYNDAFGSLSCRLAGSNTSIITDLKSQETAIQTNAVSNHIEIKPEQFFLLKDALPKPLQVAYLKVPKSVALLETYLQHIHSNLESDGKVICGFMTKYFNKNWLALAGKYFENVEQSKAKKKARLLILSGKKDMAPQKNIENFQYHHLNLQQYKGIFSGGKVDKATNYLLQNLQIPEAHNSVLDLACGNGIIGKWILDKTSINEMHFLDDSHLALASAQLNVTDANVQFHHNYELNDFEENSLDWVVTNPPFHFENTIDISIPINLCRAAKICLKPGGLLTIVANSNVGYEAFLKRHFTNVEIQNSDHQFKIYQCFK
ncbi:MAG: class I SAM-dependent methyltransferase [Flavobacteriaceae bacterium]|nr:class I SAM-dependent methyltransferase [Flavobacteriaceae bacterium]